MHYALVYSLIKFLGTYRPFVWGSALNRPAFWPFSASSLLPPGAMAGGAQSRLGSRSVHCAARFNRLAIGTFQLAARAFGVWPPGLVTVGHQGTLGLAIWAFRGKP